MDKQQNELQQLKDALQTKTLKQASLVAEQIIGIYDKDFHRKLYWAENKEDLETIRREQFQGLNVIPIVKF